MGFHHQRKQRSHEHRLAEYRRDRLQRRVLLYQPCHRQSHGPTGKGMDRDLQWRQLHRIGDGSLKPLLFLRLYVVGDDDHRSSDQRSNRQLFERDFGEFRGRSELQRVLYEPGRQLQCQDPGRQERQDLDLHVRFKRQLPYEDGSLESRDRLDLEFVCRAAYGDRPLSEETQWTYDSYGNCLTKVDPLTHTVLTNTYDGYGELLTSKDGDSNETQFGYTSGNLTSVEDALTNSSTIGVDGMNRAVTFTDPLSHEEQTSFDNWGRVVTITHADSTTVSKSYSATSQLISLTDENGKTENFSYDDAGRLSSTTNARSD